MHAARARFARCRRVVLVVTPQCLAVSQEGIGSQLCHTLRGIHATSSPSRPIKTAGAVKLALLSSVRRRRRRRVSALLRQARRAAFGRSGYVDFVTANLPLVPAPLSAFPLDGPKLGL